MLGAGEILQITLVLAEHLSEGVLAGLITAWLLRKLGSREARVTSLQIDRVTVELNEEQIRRVVLEKIREREPELLESLFFGRTSPSSSCRQDLNL